MPQNDSFSTGTRVYHASILETVCLSDFDTLFRRLHPAEQKKVVAYKKWQDAQCCLLGKLILLNALMEAGYDEFYLLNLKYNKFNKPYFENGPSFNISHSGEIVACAIKSDGLIGIDIEKVDGLDTAYYRDFWNEEDWNYISSSPDHLTTFYKCWTRKEALLKTSGHGLNADLSQVNIQTAVPTWAGKKWFLKEINIAENYCCHIASDTAIDSYSTVKKNCLQELRYLMVQAVN